MDIWFRYPGSVRDVLRGVSLTVRPGESCALMAPSGEGKTTMLSIAGLLIAADRGRVEYSGTPVGTRDAGRMMAREVAWVLQTVNLLPRRSVLDNVALPLIAQGGEREDSEQRARDEIEAIGLSGLVTADARRLSGGEAQRAAIARALVTRPRVLLADEPSANLDHATARGVMQALLDARRDAAVLLATHDERIAALADRTVHLIDGRVRA
jgi:ABC-type lipoprotein export system ATPase subunit